MSFQSILSELGAQVDKLAEASALHAESLATLAADVAALKDDAPAPEPAPEPPPPAPDPPAPPPPDGESPVVLRVIKLSDYGPKVTSVSPNMGENGTYNRKPLLVFYETVEQRTWSWQIGQGEIPGTLPRLRMVVDGDPVTDWIDAIDPVKGKYDFSYVVGNGHHVCYVEAENDVIVQPMAVPFTVNDTGVPLPDQAPWTAVNRFEKTYPKLLNHAVQIRYGSAAPAIRPLKPRPPEPFDVLLDKSEMTVVTPVRNIGASLSREWALIPTGDIVIEAAQKYFHSNAISRPEATEWEPPGAAVQDGPRGVGSMAYVCDAIIRSGGRGVYNLETNGALRHMSLQGKISTLIGKRMKAGIRPHSGVLSDLYMYPGKHDAWYESFWEEVADWSLVTEAPGLWEPWGMCFFSVLEDGTIDYRDGHAMYIANTRKNSIEWGNHYTAHSPDSYRVPPVVPVGYIPPAEPTGKTQMFRLVHPGPLCKEPWKVRFNPRDHKLYWTNFAGNSIARCNPDGTNQEMVFESAVHPVDSQLGVPKRLSWGSAALSLRDRFMVDGQQGTATLIRPTGFDFDEFGNIVVVEHYLYSIRKIALFDETGAEIPFADRTITFMAKILDANGGSDSSGNKEPALVIDRDGTTGPAGDIFVSAWGNNTDLRFDKNGVARTKSGRGMNRTWRQWMFNSGQKMTNGRMDLCDGPGYSWGFDVWGGAIFTVGNAAGNQMWWATKRKPDDPTVDLARWTRGKEGVNGLAEILMGQAGQGNLGLPTAEGMMDATDEEFKSYLLSLDVHPLWVDDAVYYYRVNVAYHE